MPTDFTAFMYAATVAGGGILGYVKSNSVPSLGAGLLFGSLLGYGAYQVSQDPHNYGTMLGTSAALASVMGYRFYKSGTLIPAGIITLMSVVMIVRTVMRHLTMPKNDNHLQ